MPHMPDSSPGFRERFFTSQDNLSLYFREYGDRLTPTAAVLCLPGLTRNCKDFHDLATHLAQKHRVVCPDSRGRGRSDYDPDWRHYEARTQINDLRHLLAVADIHRAVVIGTSFGGLIAMALAVAAPTAVAGVVLNDIGPEVNQSEYQRILDYISRDRPQPDWESATRHLRQMFPKLSFKDEAGWLTMARNTYREGPDGVLHFDWDVSLVKPLRANAGRLPDLWPLFRALGALPVLAIRGALSDVLSEDTFERMAEAKPDLIRVTVPDVGHAPALNEPEALTAIDDFLTAL